MGHTSQHLSRASSLEHVYTGVGVKGFIMLSQIGNILRRGPQFAAQHPDPEVCVTPQPGAGLSCSLRAQEKMLPDTRPHHGQLWLPRPGRGP